MPIAPNGVIWFEGVQAKSRGVAMLREARRIYTARTGRKPPRISQGGFSGAVAVSGGTHGREAFDTAVAGYLTPWWKAWEEALWEVGFAAWHRPFIWNVWPEHCHCIPKGGDLSRQAQAQERAFRNRRDGLVGNRSYPRIPAHLAGRTWEQYLAAKNAKHKIKIGQQWFPDISRVTVSALTKAWRGTYVSRFSWYVQKWLAKLGFYKDPIDGVCGPKTRAAYDAFRRSIGYAGKDATGLPGLSSLTALAKKAKSAKPVTQS
jgi:hypothetical protein